MPRPKKPGILMGGNMLQKRILLAIVKLKEIERKIDKLLR
jgi:hypothetical protein